MITMNSLKAKFGNDWAPDCPPLNEFEGKCKKQWGKPLVCFFIYYYHLWDIKIIDFALIVERKIWSGCIRRPITTVFLIVKQYEISLIVISL